MTDSAHGADELPAYEQRADNMASAETAAEDRGAHGDVAHAIHNMDAHGHRDAVPTRGQTAYPITALSEAALSDHNANNASHTTGTIEAWASEQSSLVSSGHHIPLQSPQQTLETPRAEVRDQDLRDYRSSNELPPALAEQTAESARAQRRVLPPGHLRATPNDWVAARDVSYGHRQARLEALEFEIALHELDYRLFCLQHELQRHLCARCEGCRMPFVPSRLP